MVTCHGLISPLIGWILEIIISIIVIYLLIYLPFKKKTQTFLKIASVILCIIILLGLPLIFITTIIDSCPPKEVKDYNQQIISKEQAAGIFKEYLSSIKSKLYPDQMPEQFIDSIPSLVKERSDSYYIIVKEGKWTNTGPEQMGQRIKKPVEYTLYKNGKLHREALIFE